MFIDALLVILMLAAIAGLVYGFVNQHKKSNAQGIAIISSLFLIASAVSFFNPFGCSNIERTLDENFNVVRLAEAEGIVDYLAKNFPSSSVVMLYDDVATDPQTDTMTVIDAIREKGTAKGLTLLPDVVAARDDENYFMANTMGPSQHLSIATLDDALQTASEADVIICFVHLPPYAEDMAKLKYWDSPALKSGKAKLLLLNDGGMDMMQNLAEEIYNGNVAGVMMNKTLSFDLGRETLPEDEMTVFNMFHEFANKDNMDRIAEERNWHNDEEPVY